MSKVAVVCVRYFPGAMPHTECWEAELSNGRYYVPLRDYRDARQASARWKRKLTETGEIPMHEMVEVEGSQFDVRDPEDDWDVIGSVDECGGRVAWPMERNP